MATLATQRGVETITAAQLRDYVSFIASDELEGRDTPSRGLDTAAKFLATNLSRWGLKPAGDNGTYFQNIALRRSLADAGQTSVQLNGVPLNSGEDYIPLASSGDATGELLFVGNGWLIKSKNIDAYHGMNARGKIVVIFAPLDALPRGISRSDLTGKPNEDWMIPSQYAKQQGAAGIIWVPNFQYLANWDRYRRRLTETGSLVVEKFQPETVAQIPSIVVSPRIANQIFAGEQHNATTLFERAYGDGNSSEPFALSSNKQVSISIKGKREQLNTQNVLAVFEGSDPVLKNEYVALGAHYDHVGVGNAVNGDAIYNGADDDASGTTTLLAIAEALAKAKTRPKRSVLFVWHTGEEKGLWGSRYFTEYPTVPLDRIVTQINLDMIGRSKQAGDTTARNRSLSAPNEIYVIGSKMMSSELGALSEAVNREYLNLTYNYQYDDPADPNRFFFRSDHYNYARKGIPIIFFFDGEHEDYHRPGDSADKLDYQKMEQVARTVYMTLWEVANLPVRPKVDKQLTDQLAR
ncbi:MAG TPA: M20/M25/M40 family metallo-hydrolase [Pyrinomonadaceae bacterium]|jgi:Zn-dependent M28 family amino/carboxypeptidase